MPRSDEAERTGQGSGERNAATIAARVLSRLPAADRERTRRQRDRRRQSVWIATAALLAFSVCLASTSSNFATHLVAWYVAADASWGATVRVLLGGIGFLSVVSAAFMGLVAFLLWRWLLRAQDRSAP